MGSQTLEILRQGVWASLTGGWFYDPHQNVFCNVVHLYIWLFLLCMPFIIYLYFTTYITWTIYCATTAILMSVLKILNLGFHVMYDKAQALSDVNLKNSSKILRETSGDEDAGIEMQVLGSSEIPSRLSVENQSDEISCDNSAVSIDYQEPISSTIDFKVDVHRKNSSESSDSVALFPGIVHQTSVIVDNSEICSTSKYRKPTKLSLDTIENNELKEILSNDHEIINKSDDKTEDLMNHHHHHHHHHNQNHTQKSLLNCPNRHESFEKDEKKRSTHKKLKRQISLDSEQMSIVETSSKLQRHRSTDGQEEHKKNKSNISLSIPHNRNHYYHHNQTSNPGRLQSLASDLYLENNYTTKSELAIENIPGDISNMQKSTPMRRDSNSTMSALYLPSTATGSSSRLRRHSNTNGKHLPNGTSVRRIKSAALETSSAKQSVSNLTPHPNSIEAISGKILRNPKHTVIPPPSKSLSRNPHLNLYPKTNNLVSNTNLNSTTNDDVYPIAEQADEGGANSGRSVSDDFTLNPDSDSDQDDENDDDEDDRGEHHDQEVDEEDEDFDEDVEIDDEKNCSRIKTNKTEGQQSLRSTESESDIDRLQIQSTDSDTENNGSRSPLLEVRNRGPIFINAKMSAIGSSSGDSKKNGKDMKKIEREKDGQIAGPSGVNDKRNANGKCEESEDPSSDGEQASAGSKDMLLSDNKELSQFINFDLGIFNKENELETYTSFKEDDNSEIPQRNLGAIPKSRVRSTSSRRLSMEDHWRPSRNIALPRRTPGSHLPQTPTAPVLTFLNSRNDHPIIPIYASPGTTSEFQLRSICRFRPRTYAVLEPNRHRQPKIRRSTRSKHQRRATESTGESSKDDIGPSAIETSPTLPPRRSVDNTLSLEKFMEETFTYSMQQSNSNNNNNNNSNNNNNRVQRQPINHVIDFNVELIDSSFPSLPKIMELGRRYLATEKPVQPKRYYNFPIHCFGKKQLKISMDRLQLLALFDRDSGWFQVITAIILSVLVSILGSFVLQANFYDDICAFIFCFVIAGSQYSLLKSVQPDAASPTHGFNKTVAFSRPIYFCLCSALLLITHHIALNSNSVYNEEDALTIFGFVYHQKRIFSYLEQILSILLLLFPVFFSLGLFPQINTFLMYFLEQVDMHLFGGNAVCSLISALVGLLRSILACLLLYGPAFGGLSEQKHTQHVLFSIFCSMLISISYHLSRSASDFSCIWNLIKSSVLFHPDDDDDVNSTEEIKNSNGDKGENKSDEKSNKESISVDKKFHQSDEDCYDITTNPTQENDCNNETELIDPLPKKLQTTVNNRLKNDLLICSVLGIIVMSLHSSTIFTILQPDLNLVLYTLAIVLGVLLHYITPQLRKHLPWLCIAKPILRQNEHGQFEVKSASKVMWFEHAYIILCFLEKNILYPLIFLSAMTADSDDIAKKFGVSLGTAIVVICGLKCLRSSYSDPSTQYLVLTFTFLFFEFDFKASSETFLINYFIVAIIFKKTCEFLLKMQFVVTYIAPWQITWGSAFHAFAQPFSVPHSAMLFLQAAISAILSTPLNPFLGSAIFLTSYVRPIKFWERDYNTKRIDHSNTRLSSQLERDLGADDNNLNSIFYEHLTRSLQHSLCGDLLLGRWGNVTQGDCFVLASDYLNCLVHIIELGNGLCTFQMRGLEFRGTYCQQREVEAISEGVEDNQGCCCCSPGHLPHMLSANAMFATRWLAWQVIAAQYVLEGYSISDNSAVATLQVFEFRKVLITYYVKSIIYYTTRSTKLQEWLSSQTIQESLQSTLDKQFVDLDPIFNHNLDDDYDFRASGVTRNSFCSIYLEWIQFCCYKRQQQNTSNEPTLTSPTTPISSNPTPSPHDNPPNPNSSNTMRKRGNKIENPSKRPEENQANAPNTSNTINMSRDSPLVSLCLALALLGRRTLATASHSSSSGVEFFLHGLHALFKGDFRITSPRDEWVFADMELLHGVVAPAVRMSLKLHQDHFLSPDEYDDPEALYTAIESHSQELVISHEADPLWRNAVLRGAPNLLALRHVMEDGSDEYRVIRLTKRYLSFRVIKLNRECVRGLWAGQQQELIYLRNRNAERGSIQNAKQALRNIINSSCDQPIGYPIYVSPLTTSYAETNQQLSRIIGGSITIDLLKKMILNFWERARKRCREGCSSGSGVEGELGDIQGVYCSSHLTPNNTLSGTTGTLSYGSQNISITGTAIRGSIASMSKPTSSTLIAGLLNRERDSDRDSVRDRGTSKRSSRSRVDRDRRATLPASNRESIKQQNINGSNIKLQESAESCNISPNQKSNNSSYINLNTTTNNNTQNSHMNNSTSLYSSNNKLSTANSLNLTKSSERIVIVDETSEHEQSIVIVPPITVELNQDVIVYDVSEIYDCLDLGRRIDVVWPNEQMRSTGGRSSWKDWSPKPGMIGKIVHYWQPNHADSHFRSNVNRTILLIQIGDRYVPIGEKGVKLYINPNKSNICDVSLSNNDDDYDDDDDDEDEDFSEDDDDDDDTDDEDHHHNIESSNIEPENEIEKSISLDEKKDEDDRKKDEVQIDDSIQSNEEIEIKPQSNHPTNKRLK